MGLISYLGYLAIPCMVCFVVGIILLVVEMLIPGFGVAGITGALALVAVIVMQFSTNTPLRAMVVTAIMLVIITILLLLSLRSFQKGMLSKSKIVNRQSIEQAATQEPVSLIGQQGVALTALRPTGMAQFGDRRVNVETAGDFIAPGSTVTVVAEEGLRTLVK